MDEEERKKQDEFYARQQKMKEEAGRLDSARRTGKPIDEVRTMNEPKGEPKKEQKEQEQGLKNEVNVELKNKSSITLTGKGLSDFKSIQSRLKHVAGYSYDEETDEWSASIEGEKKEKDERKFDEVY